MQILRQIASGLALGGIFLALLLGGFALSQAEGGVQPVLPSPSLPPASPSGATAAPVFLPTLPPYTQFASPTFAATSTLSASLTPPPPPTSCMPPAGWVAVLVQPADSLESLAQTYGANPQEVLKQNCLFVPQLVVGSFLYLPPLPTITPIPCGAPAGWVNHLISPGETLYSISLLYRTDISALQNANCLGKSTYILAGTFLKVPNVPTSTPAVTIAPLPTLTHTPTWALSSPTPSPSLTPLPLPTETPSTPLPSPTFTPILDWTLTPSPTLPATTPTSVPEDSPAPSATP